MSAHILCVGGEDDRFRLPFLSGLRRQGFRITAAGSGDPIPFERAGIEYRSWPFDRFINPLADLKAIAACTRLIRAVNPQLVQTFDTKPNLLVPLSIVPGMGARVVRTINGLGWLYSSASAKALLIRPAFCALHRRAAHTTAMTVFQNGQDQHYFARRGLIGKSEHCLIQGSGVDVDGFDKARAAAPAPETTRRRLGLGDCPVVVTVTRLTRQKGVGTLLEAAALVHAVRPDVRFLLVGPRESEGPFAVSQAELDRHAGYVIATGPRSDVPALLAASEVFVLPTEYREGVPRALLEAALAELPIVTTDMPGCNDVVTDGWTGLLVPPRSPRELADGILQLLDDRAGAAVMARRGAELVRRDFGLSTVLARYTEVYNSLLDTAPTHTIMTMAGG